MFVDVLARSGEAAKSGPIGLAIILILCIVCYFLFRSMAKHMRKVHEQFPDDSAPTEQRRVPTPGQSPAGGDDGQPAAP